MVYDCSDIGSRIGEARDFMIRILDGFSVCVITSILDVIICTCFVKQTQWPRFLVTESFVYLGKYIVFQEFTVCCHISR